jgi:hypothetical protein
VFLLPAGEKKRSESGGGDRKLSGFEGSQTVLAHPSAEGTTERWQGSGKARESEYVMSTGS